MIPKKQKLNALHSSQAGFTLIEALLAILVVTILMVGLGPVIVLSTATRVQARRVERATDAAKTYIDGIRSGAIAAPTTTVGVAPSPTAGTGSSSLLNGALPPSGNLTCTTGAAYCSLPDNVFCVDLDDTAGCSPNSPNDLVVQGFRTATTSADAKDGYRLGVRVYRADAFKGGKTLIAGTKKATFTGGTGSSQREAPLVEMTTDIVTGKTTFSDWCNRLKNSSNNNNSGC